MDKNERNAVKKIKYLLQRQEPLGKENIEEICDSLLKIKYINILSQKILLKIILSTCVNSNQKRLLIDRIIEQYPLEKVENYVFFVKVMVEIEDKYISYIREQIIREFDSLFVFLAVLGKYTRENPEIIEFPKRKMIEVAQEELKNDVTLNENQALIIISNETYKCKRDAIEDIYNTAIKIGCIIEKFDDVSFCREEIANVNIDTIPFFELKVTDWEWKKRLMFSSEYYTAVMHDREEKKDYEADVMYNFYKCYICRKATILNIAPEVEYIIYSMLGRQFAAEKIVHLFARYISASEYKLADIISYCFSIYLLLYIELLFLLLIDTRGYMIYGINEIKKNMFGSNIISDMEFEQALKICIREENDSIKSEFYKKGNGIVLGSWMFNSDLFISEKISDFVFSMKRDASLGQEVNKFGKEVFEKVIKRMANDNNWKTIESDIKIKSTDFDLVAYKEGVVLLGQIKACHTTRTPYSLWRANEIIIEASEQIVKCQRAIQEDRYLLYSNLKREKIVSQISDIQRVVFVIISGNGYLNGNGEFPVIGIEDWNNFLKMDVSSSVFYDYIECPPAMYLLDNRPEYRESIIKTEEFILLYNELE